MDMKQPWYLLSDDGKKSLSFTMVVIAFLAVTLWMIGYVVGCAFGFPVPAFDATSAIAYLSPILATYSFRKHDKKKKEKSEGDV